MIFPSVGKRFSEIILQFTMNSKILFWLIGGLFLVSSISAQAIMYYLNCWKAFPKLNAVYILFISNFTSMKSIDGFPALSKVYGDLDLWSQKSLFSASPMSAAISKSYPPTTVFNVRSRSSKTTASFKLEINMKVYLGLLIFIWMVIV